MKGTVGQAGRALEAAIAAAIRMETNIFAALRAYGGGYRPGNLTCTIKSSKEQSKQDESKLIRVK